MLQLVILKNLWQYGDWCFQHFKIERVTSLYFVELKEAFSVFIEFHSYHFRHFFKTLDQCLNSLDK
jgi:hypothetical protein